MKAIRVREFGGPEVLKLEEVPDPTPGPGQVVVRMKAVGVNPVETYVRSGKYTRLPELPYTPGTDAGGTIEAVGTDVADVAPGDRVYVYGAGIGTYAELVLCQQDQVYALPEKASFAQGAAIGVACGAAWRGLFHRGKAQPGETVLVHGATGGVGIAAVQLARAAGLTVIATAGSERGKRLVQEQGAHHVLEHEQANDPAQIKSLTGGKGLDLIVEMLANINLGKDLGILAKNGRVVIIGSRGPVEIDPRLTMTLETDIRGMTLMNATPEDLRVMHAALGTGLKDGTLRPVIAQEIPLAEAPKAHEAVMQGEAYGKIVLVP